VVSLPIEKLRAGRIVERSNHGRRDSFIELRTVNPAG
jgi:hypothetical protein